MTTPPYMRWYPSDYLADTMHLTRDEHGGYFLLLQACWGNGGKLPDNDQQLALITKCVRGEWPKLRKKLSPFFKISHGFWRQKRLTFELREAQKSLRQHSEAGQKGAASRWQRKAKADNGSANAVANGAANGAANATANGIPEPEPDSEPERRVSKAKLQASEPRSKINNQLPAHAREGSAGEQEVFLDGNWKPVGRCAPLAASRPERPTAALKARRKELLRQKLLRFVAARLPASDEHAATLGLCGGDPEHSEQWWLDTLDIRMLAEKWDDTQEFWEGENAS